MNYKYQLHIEFRVYGDDYASYSYSFGMFDTFREAADLGNELRKLMNYDRSKVPGLKGQKFEENYLWGMPNNLIVDYLQFRKKNVSEYFFSIEKIKVIDKSELKSIIFSLKHKQKPNI